MPDKKRQQQLAPMSSLPVFLTVLYGRPFPWARIISKVSIHDKLRHAFVSILHRSRVELSFIRALYFAILYVTS